MLIDKNVVEEFEKVLRGLTDYYLNYEDNRFRVYLVDDYITIECSGSDYTINTVNRTDEEVIEDILLTIVKHRKRG